MKKNKKYSIIGYKGKQVRDNIHSSDLVNCFWEVFKKPKRGEVYKKVLEIFPDAELIDIDVKQDEN